MIDIDKIIGQLEYLNHSFAEPYPIICDAVKVMKMWKETRRQYGHAYIPGHTSVNAIMDIMEGYCFPTIIKAKVVAYIESGYDYSAIDVLKAIQEVQGVKGAAISNVKEK